MSTKISLVEFKKLLDGHDWHYEMADDFRVWQKGKEQQKVLESISGVSEEYKHVFDIYKEKNRRDI